MPVATAPRRILRDSEQQSGVPAYEAELAAFHRAFAAELKTAVGLLPFNPQMRILDVGCGDGFYVPLLAEGLRRPGRVTGLDINEACLALARDRSVGRVLNCDIDFRKGSLDDLPLDELYDIAWCAQSLYTFPDPGRALAQMARAVRPGGIVAVLENDTLHSLILPWPDRLEIALRGAEHRVLCDQSPRSEKYYVGRQLPAVMAEAGLEPLGFKTQCIDRRAPLDADLEAFLRAYLARIGGRAAKYLDPSHAGQLAALVDPQSESYLLRQPNLTVCWINMLAWARRPVGHVASGG